MDLNRAGIPLMELVFNHDLNNGEEAASLVKELVAVLQALNTCNCKMEGILLYFYIINIKTLLLC